MWLRYEMCGIFVHRLVDYVGMYVEGGRDMTRFTVHRQFRQSFLTIRPVLVAVLAVLAI